MYVICYLFIKACVDIGINGYLFIKVCVGIGIKGYLFIKACGRDRCQRLSL